LIVGLFFLTGPRIMSHMKAHTLGHRVAEVRGTYSIDRETLAERSGVTVDLIAKIEDEGMLPDLAPLLQIARALGVRVGTLLDDHEERGPVITRADDVVASARFITGCPENSGAVRNGSHGLNFKSLAATKGGRHMEPFLIEVEPAVREKSTHEGEEFLYVLSGDLKFEYGNTAETLKPGDSVYYDAIVPHRISCVGDSSTRVLAVIYTPL